MFVEKKPRSPRDADPEMAAELDTLHTLETGFTGAVVTVNIEVAEDIYRPGGSAGAVPLFHDEKPRDAHGSYPMV